MVILTVCVCVWSVLVDPAWAEVVFIWSSSLCVCVWSVLVVPAWAEVVFILVILTVCICMECASSPSMG